MENEQVGGNRVSLIPYDYRRGQSVYPMERGDVVRLTEVKRLRAAGGMYLDYQSFLWVQGGQFNCKSVPHKKLKTTILEVFVPISEAYQKTDYIRVKRSKIQRHTLRVKLMKGYELIGNVNFNWSPASFSQFYCLCGVIESKGLRH